MLWYRSVVEDTYMDVGEKKSRAEAKSNGKKTRDPKCDLYSKQLLDLPCNVFCSSHFFAFSHKK